MLGINETKVYFSSFYAKYAKHGKLVKVVDLTELYIQIPYM